MRPASRHIVALLGLLILVLPGILLGQEIVTVSADTVFARLPVVWEKADEKGFASLVHPDGLRATHGGDYHRYTLYSPDQAHYYFLDLLAQGQDKGLKFRRLPDPPEGDRCLGMLEWSLRRPGYHADQVMKFVVVLTRHEGGWFMSEFNSISQR